MRASAGFAVGFAALFAGCRDDCAPTIRGGTAEQRGAVASAAEVFRDLLDPSLSVCVPQVEIGDVPASRDAYGLYRIRTRRVFLAPGAPDLVVFHELCHAIQHQNDLPLLPEWAVDPSFAFLYGLTGDEEDRASEGFAHACSMMVTGAPFLGDGCPLDATDLGPLRAAADLFVGSDPRVVDPRPRAAREVFRSAHSGAWTAERLDGGIRLHLGDRAVDLSLPDGAQRPLPGDAASLDSTSAALGDAVVRMTWFDSPDGARALRRIWQQGGRTSPLGCWQPDETLFEAGGWLWTAHRDGPDVVVAGWSP